MSTSRPVINPTDPPGAEEADPKRPAQVSRTFTLFGVPIRLHFTFILFFAFLLITARGAQSALINGVYIAAFFTSVLLHELGHSAVSRRYGIRTLEIVLYPIGGVARLERMPKPKEELWIALAGPAVNVLIALALGAWLLYASGSIEWLSVLNPTDSNLFNRIALANLVLAAFNMLPAFPMDGGRVLRALLARSRPEDEATRLAATIGKVMAVLMGIFGLLNGMLMLMFIAVFVYVAASAETAVVVGRTLTLNIPVRAAMITDFRTLEHGNTIREAADLLLATSQTDFPVVLGSQVIGMLGRNALLRGMAVNGPDAYVAGIMERDFARVDPDTGLDRALPLIAQTPCALVMKEESLVGLLTRENVNEFLMLRQVGMKPDLIHP